jgi:hypothetical protein
MLQKWTLLLEKPEKLVFHNDLHAFFNVFPGTNYENTLLVDGTPYKSLFNPPFNGIFLEIVYKSQAYGDYLFRTIFLYLEALHSKMQVYKFVECNPLTRIRNVFPFDLQYEKLDEPCSLKCNDNFCHKMKCKLASKEVNIWFSSLSIMSYVALNFFLFVVYLFDYY